MTHRKSPPCSSCTHLVFLWITLIKYFHFFLSFLLTLYTLLCIIIM
nr:MAG TPA: hypothetical protein [Caudoviricetes sp.]